MKKILLAVLFILCLPIICHADGMVIKPMVVTTDSCVGGLLFSWHMENADVTLGGVAGGVNNGCSLGDTVGNIVGSATINADVTPYDGSSSVDIPTGVSYYDFVVNSDDIINDAAGTIVLYVYVQTFAHQARIVDANISTSTDDISIQMLTSGVNKFRITYMGSSVSRVATTSNAVSFPLNQWLKVTGKWSVSGVGGLYLSISYDDAYTGTNNSAITAMSGNPDDLWIGNVSSPAADFHVDNIKIYDSWLE